MQETNRVVLLVVVVVVVVVWWWIFVCLPKGLTIFHCSTGRALCLYVV